MTVSKETESEILRLFHAEKWKRGTIARQLHIHHGAVDRILTKNGIAVERVRVRSSKIDPYLPFIRSVLEKYPRLTASRLFEMVRQRGYSGAAGHFRGMVARHRPGQPKHTCVSGPCRGNRHKLIGHTLARSRSAMLKDRCLAL